MFINDIFKLFLSLWSFYLIFALTIENNIIKYGIKLVLPFLFFILSNFFLSFVFLCFLISSCISFSFPFRALLYPESSYLMFTDFRDIIFQSNPFLYRAEEWQNDFQLVVFQEFHPNMVILNLLSYKYSWRVILCNTTLYYSILYYPLHYHSLSLSLSLTLTLSTLIAFSTSFSPSDSSLPLLLSFPEYSLLFN